MNELRFQTMKTRKENTPIRDGDTRPDQNIHGDVRKKSSPLASDKKKLTKARGADIDTEDDHKDAK